MPILNRSKRTVALLLATASLLAAAGSHAIDADADRILRAMGDYLQSANEFSFRADITREETLSTGEKVQYGARSVLSVRRPDLPFIRRMEPVKSSSCRLVPSLGS